MRRLIFLTGLLLLATAAHSETEMPLYSPLKAAIPLHLDVACSSAFTSCGFIVAFGSGGTGLTTAADDTTLVSSGSAWVAKALPDCVDSAGNHLNYTASTNAFSCGTTGGAAGASVALDNLASVAINAPLGLGGTATTFPSIEWNTVQTVDTGMLLTGSTSNHWVVAERADGGFDFAHAATTNPTLFIHSAAQSTTQWLGLAHNGTNAVITTGAGSVSFPAGIDFYVNSASAGNVYNSFGGARITWDVGSQLKFQSSDSVKQFLLNNKGWIIDTNANWAPTCTFASGGGTSPSCAIDTNSANSGGTLVLTTGSGAPGATGTVTLTFSGAYGTNVPVCVFQLQDGAAAWNGAATVNSITAASTTAVTVAWSNGVVLLTTATTYKLNYFCLGK